MIDSVQHWLTNPVTQLFLIRTLGPIPVWMAIFVFIQFFKDRKREASRVLGLGFAWLVVPYPALYLIEMRFGNTGVLTRYLADFTVSTGAAFLGWGLAVPISNPLNKWFAKRHAKRLSGQR